MDASFTTITCTRLSTGQSASTPRRFKLVSTRYCSLYTGTRIARLSFDSIVFDLSPAHGAGLVQHQDSPPANLILPSLPPLAAVRPSEDSPFRPLSFHSSLLHG